MAPLAGLFASLGSAFATAAPVAAEGAAVAAPAAAETAAVMSPIAAGSTAGAMNMIPAAGSTGAVGGLMPAMAEGSKLMGTNQSNLDQAYKATGVLGQLAGLGASILQKAPPQFSPMSPLRLSAGQQPDLMGQLGQMQAGFRGN